MRELGAPEVWTPLAVGDPAEDDASLSRRLARLKHRHHARASASPACGVDLGAFRERFPDVLGPRAGKFGALELKDAFVRPDTRTTLLVLARRGVLSCCSSRAPTLPIYCSCAPRDGGGEIGVRRALGASSLRIVQEPC